MLIYAKRTNPYPAQCEAERTPNETDRSPSSDALCVPRETTSQRVNSVYRGSDSDDDRYVAIGCEHVVNGVARMEVAICLALWEVSEYNDERHRHLCPNNEMVFPKPATRLSEWIP